MFSAPSPQANASDGSLDVSVKVWVLSNCSKIDDNVTIRPVLINAVKNQKAFPGEFGEELASLQAAYATNKSNPMVEPFIGQAIEGYIDSKGLDLFRQLLQGEEFANWSSDFIRFIADGFGIKIGSPPFIEVAIREGKIYWRIMQGENVRFVRDASWNEVINSASRVRMTWEQFRRFKDAGKRSGTVAITKERFQNFIVWRYGPHLIGKADSTWEELKQKNILNHRDRLSHRWRVASAKNIELSNNSLLYDQVIVAFEVILSDPNFGEKFDTYYPGAAIYRPERSPKNWAKTGRVTYKNGTSEKNSVKEWDVGVLDELYKHALTRDGLDHEHIPSTASQKASQQKLLTEVGGALESLNQKIYGPTGYFLRQIRNNDAETQKLLADYEEWSRYRDFISGESKDDWWCIAMSGALHEDGPTHAKNEKAQAALVSQSLLDEVCVYLGILKPTLSSEEYLQVLGAFRYLYRCQVKEPSYVIPFEYDRSCVAWNFFNDKGKRDNLDQLFYDQLVSCLQTM